LLFVATNEDDEVVCEEQSTILDSFLSV
jgi:hypothetical protein